MEPSEGYSFSLMLLVLLVASFILWKTYEYFTNPLAHLPGPKVSQWTNLRFQLAVMTGERTRYEYSLHQRYGPVVRVSPREVSLASIACARTIYRVGSPYHKTQWYNIATGEFETGLFQTIDAKKHAVHRRLLAHDYSEDWVKQMEPYIAEKTRVAVAKMEDDCKTKGCVDIYKWFIFMATDAVSEAAFGHAFGLLEIGEKNQYIRDLENDSLRGILRAEFPLLMNLVSYFAFGSADEISEGHKRMKSYADERLYRYWEAYRNDPENVKSTLLTKEYASFEAGSVDIDQVRTDATTNILAGTDTTASTATYAVWLMSQNPELEARLIEEVSKLPPSFTDLHLQTLGFLNNTITETLRIRPSVGQALPRAVPPGGVNFEGHWIPAGTTVGIPAYSMHRITDIFPDPEKFDPSRWEKPTKEMKEAFVPFGGGSRICIGSNVALLELRHALANFYRTFKGGMAPSRAEGFKEEDMKPMSFFVTSPKGRRCVLERRSGANQKL